MAKLCPFKKETVTNIEYGFTSVEREKPIKIKTEMLPKMIPDISFVSFSNIIPGFTFGIAAINNAVVSLACYFVGKKLAK